MVILYNNGDTVYAVYVTQDPSVLEILGIDEVFVTLLYKATDQLLVINFRKISTLPLLFRPILL